MLFLVEPVFRQKNHFFDICDVIFGHITQYIHNMLYSFIFRLPIDQNGGRGIQCLYRKLKAFKATIKALPRPADATLDHMEAIRAAQREFEEIQLDPDLRDSLSVAETKKMNELIETIDDLLWQDAIDKIDAIGEVTKDSGEAIAAAKAAVSRLTEKQLETFPKDKLEKLAEAEKKYRELTEGKPSKPGSSGTVTRPVSPNKPKPEPAKADASKFRDVSSSDWYFDAVQYVLSLIHI